MATTQIIISLIKLFLMIIPGFILSKARIIDEHQSKGISSIIINLTWPCLILMSLQRKFSKELCINMGILAIVMVADILVAFLFAKAISKGLKLDRSLTYHCPLDFHVPFDAGFSGDEYPDQGFDCRDGHSDCSSLNNLYAAV